MHRVIEEGKIIFEKAILSLLEESIDYINNIERNGRGELPITGVALDTIPWFEQFAISFRSTSEFPCGDFRFNSADWDHYDFTVRSNHPDKLSAIKFMCETYEDSSREKIDSAHLLFLAGAEAIMSQTVSNKLSELEIKAPVVNDRPHGYSFEYIVTDPDGSVNGNYCEIVVANRMLNRLENA